MDWVTVGPTLIGNGSTGWRIELDGPFADAGGAFELGVVFGGGAAALVGKGGAPVVAAGAEAGGGAAEDAEV